MIFLELLFTFFKIGLFTFGGGYAMIALIQSEVLGKEWITQSELIDFIAISESTPGPFAINIATFIGNELAGILGAVFATLGVVLPSFIVILIVAKCYDRFKKSKLVKGCMSGLKPATIGLIAAAVISIASAVFIKDSFSFEIFSSPMTYVSLGIFILMTILIFKIKKLSPIYIICLSGLIGIVFGYMLDFSL
ncbi:MAG: chromate transporter [Clostridia bacterium]|nr:chromate transporter [Clostridia bacterium]